MPRTNRAARLADTAPRTSRPGQRLPPEARDQFTVGDALFRHRQRRDTELGALAHDVYQNEDAVDLSALTLSASMRTFELWSNPVIHALLLAALPTSPQPAYVEGQVLGRPFGALATMDGDRVRVQHTYLDVYGNLRSPKMSVARRPSGYRPVDPKLLAEVVLTGKVPEGLTGELDTADYEIASFDPQWLDSQDEASVDLMQALLSFGCCCLTLARAGTLPVTATWRIARE